MRESIYGLLSHVITMQNTKTPIVFFYVSLFIAQLMVGINIVGAKYLIGHFSIIFIITVRFIIAVIFLSVMHLLTMVGKPKIQTQQIKDLTQRDWFYITAQGLCAGVFFNLILLFGLHYTSANAAGIISSVLPAMIVVFSIIFLREHLSIFSALCVFFAVAGLLVINAHNFGEVHSSQLWGDVIVLLALVPEAAYYVLAKMHINKLPIFLMSALLHIVNLPILLVIAIFTPDFFPAHMPLESLGVLMVIGTASALFYVFWCIGCTRVSGATAGLFTAAMPIATLIIAWLFLHEGISILQFFGMLLVIVSIVFNALARGKKAVPILDEVQPV